MGMMVILVVIRVLVVVEAARRMIVGGFFSGMAVHESMGVAVLMLVKMVVGNPVVPVGMGKYLAQLNA